MKRKQKETKARRQLEVDEGNKGRQRGRRETKAQGRPGIKGDNGGHASTNDGREMKRRQRERRAK